MVTLSGWFSIGLGLFRMFASRYYQRASPRNSSSAMLYARFVIADETLSSTSAFNRCHCAIFSARIKSFFDGQ